MKNKVKTLQCLELMFQFGVVPLSELKPLYKDIESRIQMGSIQRLNNLCDSLNECLKIVMRSVKKKDE